MTDRKYLCCSECGSRNVEVRVTKTWNTAKQQWVEDEPFYWGSYCFKCETVDGELLFKTVKARKK